MEMRKVQQQLCKSSSYQQYKHESNQPLEEGQQLLRHMRGIRERADSFVGELTALERGRVLNGLGNERWFAMFEPNKLDPNSAAFSRLQREGMPAAIGANAPEFGWYSSIHMHRSGQAQNFSLPVEPKR